MGAVFKPSDILKGRRRFVEELTRDLSPDKREIVIRVLESWREGESKDKLEELVGPKLSKRILRELK